MSQLFCFIPAKLGSVRLPKKNIMPFKGKPMLQYVVEAAMGAKIFNDNVVVSTESTEIQDIAKSAGAVCPYLREESLAKDPYGVEDVLMDFFERFPEYIEYKTICILLPTSPLNDSKEIEKAYEQFTASNSKGLVSVTEFEQSAFRSVTISDSGTMNAVFPDKFKVNSKEHPKTYRVNGAIMFLDIATFLEKKTYLFEDMQAYPMPLNKSVDVDTAEDAKLVEFFMENRP